MNNFNIKHKSYLMSIILMMAAIGSVVLLSSCEEELPAAGSLPDLTPPTADFSTSADNTNSKKIKFSNLSASATDFVWDFGDGNTSTDDEPSNLYPSKGIYSVTLTAKDKLGASSVITKDIEVTEPELYEPFILEPGFEDGTLEGGLGDGRDSWRTKDADGSNGDDRPGGMGGVIQITGDPVTFGVQGAKLPNDNTRAGYQLITVIPNSEYKISFYYTMKNDVPAGTLTVAILGGPVTDPADVAAATIASVTLNDQTDPSSYVKETIDFNSGNNTAVAIYFYNTDVECRLDEFSIANNN